MCTLIALLAITVFARFFGVWLAPAGVLLGSSISDAVPFFFAQKYDFARLAHGELPL
ncbi:MAG TPA: hypothetical protein PKM88_16455 [bacterium]|nr:hypothetical protein [bacterium]